MIFNSKCALFSSFAKHLSETSDNNRIFGVILEGKNPHDKQIVDMWKPTKPKTSNYSL